MAVFALRSLVLVHAFVTLNIQENIAKLVKKCKIKKLPI
jgi:hypothetical protein